MAIPQTAFRAAFLLLALSSGAVAQRIIIDIPPHPPHPPFPPPPHPRPRVEVVRPRAPEEIRLEGLSIQADIEERSAVVSAKPTFFNPNPREMEGTYIMSLPADARVHGLSMEVGGKTIEAEILAADKARAIYEEIVRKRRDPALLEEFGCQMIRARVFPIPARGRVSLDVRYTQELKEQGGLVTYQTFNLKSEESLKRFLFVANIRSDRPIRKVFCHTHDLDVARESDTKIRASIEKTSYWPVGPVKLYCRFDDREVSATVFCHRKRPSEAGTFYLSLNPKLEVREDEVLPKDVVFVFDTSGSMAGEKIEQAKGTLRFALANLRAKDRFAIVDFATEARTFGTELCEATKDSVERAREYVNALTARGGTAIHEALLKGLEYLQGAGSDRMAVVIFLTDGLPTIGERDPDRIIKDVCGKRAKPVRLFAFGVGEDVNARLLDTLTADNGGTADYVAPKEDLEIPISQFYEKIASPVLTELDLRIDGVTAEEIYPKELPALFKGSAITVLGRYRSGGEARIVLKGRRGDHAATFEFRETFPETDRENESLPRLWAFRKIGYLLREVRMRGTSKELTEEIVRLAKEHGVVVEGYTSQLIAEDVPLDARSLGLYFDRHHREESGAYGRGRLGAGGSSGRGASPTRSASTARRMRSDEPGAAAPTEEALRETARLAAVRDAEGRRRPSAAGEPGYGMTPLGDLSKESREGEEAWAEIGRLGTGKPRTVEDVMRQVAGRTFYRRGDLWIDARLEAGKDEPKAERIEFLSDRYLELMRSSQEIAQILSLGNEILFSHDGKLYRITDK